MHSDMDAYSRTRARMEMTAVLVTGGTFLIFENILELKLQFVIPCILIWTTYLTLRLLRHRDLAREWGLTTHRFGPAAREAALFGIAAVTLLALYRILRGWTPLPLPSIVIFALYPFWSFIQQFAVQDLVALNLERLGLPRLGVILLTGLLFGLVHLPDWELVALTGAAGWAWTWLFLRKRNLYPIALLHAVLGTLTYYWILERNPWNELFPE